MATKTVIVIDDEESIAAVITCILEDEGYRVLSACDGADGMRQIRMEPPALVITDIMMPMLDGHGVLKAMREDLLLQRIPVVLMSAASRGGNAAGAPFLSKPFNIDALVGLVSAQIGPA